jgi:hypothetical protein
MLFQKSECHFYHGVASHGAGFIKACHYKDGLIHHPFVSLTRDTEGTEKRLFSFAAEKGGKRKTFSFAGAERNANLWDRQSIDFRPKA